MRTQHTPNSADATLKKYVRVRSDNGKFIEFDFAISSPELFVELILPKQAFESFCTTNQVEFMTQAQMEQIDQEMEKWRYGEETLMAANHARHS